MGSFVPWLYYGFYCHYEHKLIYLSVVVVLGIVSIIVSLYDKFSEPNLRPLRAGKFGISFREYDDEFVTWTCILFPFYRFQVLS